MLGLHLFPYQDLKARSRVIIYGCGCVGKQYIDQIIANSYCQIKYVVDQNLEYKEYRGINIEHKVTVDDSFDYIVIAVGEEHVATEIKNILLNIDVPKSKIIWHDTYAKVTLQADNGQLYGCCTYAQHGDDLMIINIFTLIGIKKPSYLDIGAHHPWDISNTALLYERGCRGINVEANQELIQAFIEERPEDVNVCSGVGAQSGIRTFYMADSKSGRNGFDKALVIKGDTKITNTIELPIKTLSEIITEYANGKFPDYLTIDIEGLEYEVLASFDLSVNGPKVISVELNELKVRDLLISYGYFPYCSTGGNLIFVKELYRNKLYCAWPWWHNGGE